MKQILAYKPQEYAYKDIMLQFQEGKPLSCEQVHLLYHSEYAISNAALSEVCRYYLKKYKYSRMMSKEKMAEATTHPTFKFALPTKKWNKNDVDAFEKNIEQALQNNDTAHLEVELTPEIFNKIKELAFDKMVYLHGYRLSMHESFFPGWFPYSVYFQWANLFGVAKYELTAKQGLTHTTVTLYFEPKNNRLIEECVQDYLIKNHLAFKPSAILHNEAKENRNSQEHQNHMTPALTLSRNKEKKEDD